MKAVNKCIRCFRMKPRVVKNIMANQRSDLMDLMRSKSQVRGAKQASSKMLRLGLHLFRHEGYSFGVNQGSLYGIVSTWPQTIYMH